MSANSLSFFSLASLEATYFLNASTIGVGVDSEGAADLVVARADCDLASNSWAAYMSA